MKNQSSFPMLPNVTTPLCHFFHRTLSFLRLYGVPALLLAGCAHFEHQTGESEPHGLVTVVEPLDSAGEIVIVKKLDGLAVKAGQTYRVKPGTHTVVVQLVETVVETSKPMSLFSVGTPAPEKPVDVQVSESGRTFVTGEQPFGVMQPVNLSVETRRTRYVTNTLPVQAGWRYALEGENVRAKKISAP